MVGKALWRVSMVLLVVARNISMDRSISVWPRLSVQLTWWWSSVGFLRIALLGRLHIMAVLPVVLARCLLALLALLQMLVLHTVVLQMLLPMLDMMVLLVLVRLMPMLSILRLQGSWPMWRPIVPVLRVERSAQSWQYMRSK